jgi:8-oxo-dGTP pyrophosphatase MutT (NUDIX family)
MQNTIYRRQAGAIAVHNGKVCIITSRNRNRWVIPKGGMEPGMTAGEVALQEAWEEAGLSGVLQREPVGTYTYEKSGNRYRVTVFVMEVTHVSEEWPEKHERTRRWLPAEDALQQLDEPGLRRLLQKVVEGEVNALPA